jgi:hypothetical protein
MNTPSTFESSLLIALTNAETPPRSCPLSSHAAIIVLTRTVRALNLIVVKDFDELAERREIAALLTGLRFEIQREAALASNVL